MLARRLVFRSNPQRGSREVGRRACASTGVAEAPSEKAQQCERGGGARGARGGSGAAAAQRGEREQAADERREVRQTLDEARTDEEQ